VHCAAGVSRSATIVIAYLIMKKNMTCEEALKFARSKRPIIDPNPGFISQLIKFEKKIKEEMEKNKKI
jgi:protein-tyrosine phosphatase